MHLSWTLLCLETALTDNASNTDADVTAQQRLGKHAPHIVLQCAVMTLQGCNGKQCQDTDTNVIAQQRQVKTVSMTACCSLLSWLCKVAMPDNATDTDNLVIAQQW